MNWIVWIIIGCEIGFWVFVILGLFTRYVFNKKNLGLFFLAMTPIIDLVLLTATALDLYNGATATIAHALAAIYIGISVGFGKIMINWADERFQYYVTKTGAKPVKLYGLAYAKNYFKGWTRHLISYVIGASLIGLVYLIIKDSDRTAAFMQVLSGWTLVLAIDFIISISYFIFPRKQKSELF
ncbi:hypothetical protein [Bacillus kwashiorkori]|uniref:hypothetical protein n=1 Tax=Bacillus kwashiorkori TaxID=1522318 RepID=UPI000782BDF9|nr:hypothetical protein [Bacillus kwashiorkori]